MKHSINLAKNGKKRISLDLNNLTVFDDPYFDKSTADIILEESPEKWLANKLKEVMNEYEERCNRN
jgi:hypothetical protein